ALGFEREDPSGLYTVSRAYYDDDTNLGNVDENVYEGVALSYSADVYSLRLSFQETENADHGADTLNTEVSFSYTGIDNFVIGGGIATGNGTNQTTPTTSDSDDVTNIHASYTAGKALIGAEWISVDGTDADAWLILLDYDVSDKLGVVLRLSEADVDGTVTGDSEKFTIAPNYAITDDLGAILEYSDGEINGSNDYEQLALELTLTF
ncbi:MAG: hypothetical protein VCA36_08710, partial [Opitutales bacterium]